MHNLLKSLIYTLFTFGYVTSSFAGSWYMHGGFGLGNQVNYNSISERKLLEQIKDNIPLRFEDFIQNTGEDINFIQNKVRHFIQDNLGLATTQDDIKSIIDTLFFSKKISSVKITIRDIYEFIHRIKIAQEILVKDNHKLYPYRQSLSRFAEMGAGYCASYYLSAELGGLVTVSDVAVRQLEYPKVDCWDLLEKRVSTKHTRLYGGIGLLKGSVPLYWISSRLKLYGQLGGVVLRGTTEQILSFLEEKELVSMPWSVAFVIGGGSQYKLSKQWKMDISWVRVIENDYIPTCNLFKLSVHRNL